MNFYVNINPFWLDSILRILLHHVSNILLSEAAQPSGRLLLYYSWTFFSSVLFVNLLVNLIYRAISLFPRTLTPPVLEKGEKVRKLPKISKMTINPVAVKLSGFFHVWFSFNFFYMKQFLVRLPIFLLGFFVEHSFLHFFLFLVLTNHCFFLLFAF